MMCVEEVMCDAYRSEYYNIVYYTSILCSSLTFPNNGMINCSLGDDAVPSYEDICSFACNTGYELTSGDTRTCQSNGSWSGSDVVCIEEVMCDPYSN